MPLQMRQRSNSVHITSGAFVPLVVICSLPPGLNPADARIVFEYNANDPGTITQMTLAASSWYATNAWQQNTLPGRIRVWTKDANQNRNPASVTNGGDFIPDGTHLPLSSIFASGTNRTVLYVEGIGTSSGWGTDKIHATVYPVPSLGTGIDDEVSYTVVRCVYKVCVTRPYICQSTWAWGWNTNYWISFPDYIQTVTNRTLFLTDYTTPSSMFSDWCEGMQSTNYDNDYHEKACAMGHAFARLEVRTPDHPAGTNLCGGWYHITTRGVRRREIFADDQDREHFVGLLEELVNRYGIVLHAYVLMDNHYHLLIETPEGNASRALQWLNVSYAAWCNARHQRGGQFFQGRYKSIPIQGDGGWALTCSVYLHLNPVRIESLGQGKSARAAERAGVMLVPPEREVIQWRLATLRHHRWSSYPAYAGYAGAPEWLTREVRGAPWPEVVARRGDWGRDLTLYVARLHGGMTLKELASQAGMSLDTVQSCVQRVRRHLPKDAALRRHHAKVLQVLADKKAE